MSETVNGNYILTLFYLQPNPKEFTATVKYFNPTEEFRMAESFGRFTFYIPKDKPKDKVYVVPNERLNEFDPSIFEVKQFKFYSVVYGKG